MNKILVEIECAANGKKYDFLLPAAMTVGAARRKIVSEINEFENSRILFPDEENCYLAEKDHQEILNDKFTLAQAGVQGGNRLIIL